MHMEIDFLNNFQVWHNVLPFASFNKVQMTHQPHCRTNINEDFIKGFTIHCIGLTASKTNNINIHWVMFTCQWLNLFIFLEKRKGFRIILANTGAFGAFLSILHAVSHLILTTVRGNYYCYHDFVWSLKTNYSVNFIDLINRKRLSLWPLCLPRQIFLTFKSGGEIEDSDPFFSELLTPSSPVLRFLKR